MKWHFVAPVGTTPFGEDWHFRTRGAEMMVGCTCEEEEITSRGLVPLTMEQAREVINEWEGEDHPMINVEEEIGRLLQ